MKLIAGDWYRIVGLGTMAGDSVCKATGGEATGYISVEGDMVPVDLKCFGPGKIGDDAMFLGHQNSYDKGASDGSL